MKIFSIPKIIQSKLGIFFLVVLFGTCKNPKLENPCDLSSKTFQNTLIAKALLSDQSNYCSLSSASTQSVNTPTFNPSAGHYTTAQNISISTTTAGASIYYTTDGTTPTTSSTGYSTPFHIWNIAGRTIQAFAVKAGLSSSVLSGVFSYPPLKSGQTTSYQAGDDGATQLGLEKSYTGPTAHATYSSDYTTKDNVTGLVWVSCSQGLSDPACTTGTAQTLSNDGTAVDATNHSIYGCNALNSSNSGNGYAGIKTWRLPTRYELETLVDYSSTGPTLNQTSFPNTQIATSYWTATIDGLNSVNTYFVFFSDGSVGSIGNATSSWVRCVSGTATTPALQYTDNGDGTVKDKSTGLVWQKCSLGQNVDSTCSGAATAIDWVTAITSCSSLSLAGKTWRLPGVNELKSLVDASVSSGATISTSSFPSTQVGQYWSSSTNASITANAWYVNFSTGVIGPINKVTTYSVRCVSGP